MERILRGRLCAAVAAASVRAARIKLAPVVCLLLLGGMTARTQADTGFTGSYAPLNWQLVNSNADGTVDWSNAPNSVLLTGGENDTNASGTTDLITFIQKDGAVSFYWNYISNDYEFALCDTAGYLLDGVYTQLSIDAGPANQSGFESISVLQGQSFGFRVYTDDNQGGLASVTISSFSHPVPEPASVAILTLGGIGLLTRRRQGAGRVR